MSLSTVLLGLLALLTVVDIATTLRIFEQGGYEQNTLMRRLMDKIGVFPALVATKLTSSGFVTE